MISNTHHLQLINKALKDAIAIKNKAVILNLYEEVTEVDLEAVSDRLFCEYESLVDQANEILEEKAAA